MLFSTWLESERRQGCSRRDSCVYFEKAPTQIWCCTGIYHQSHTDIRKTPSCVSCIGVWYENIENWMSLNYPTPWKRNGNFVRGPRAVGWLWEDRHRGLSHLNFPVLEKSLGLILLCLPEQFLALSILQSPQVGAHSTGGLLGRSFLKRPGHGFVLLSFFQSFYSCSCYS